MHQARYEELFVHKLILYSQSIKSMRQTPASQILLYRQESGDSETLKSHRPRSPGWQVCEMGIASGLTHPEHDSYVGPMQSIWALAQPINLPLSLCLSLPSRQQDRSWFLLILILCIQLSAKHNKCVTSQVRFQEVALFSFSIAAQPHLWPCL